MAEIKAEITTEKNTKEAAIDSENMKTKAEMTSESAITETKDISSPNQNTTEDLSKEPICKDDIKDKKDETVESGFEIINKEDKDETSFVRIKSKQVKPEGARSI